jgi:glucuronate isomerase
VPERAITGEASPREKFDQWAATVPQTLGNPLFHWSALELQRTFGVTELLSPANADAVWEKANALLRQPTHRARSLLASAQVELVCTSDRWLDDLSAHRTLAQSGYETRVLPSLRADDALAIDEPGFTGWVDALAEVTGGAISDLDGFLQALSCRLDVFAAHGCVLSDHGLDRIDYRQTTPAAAAAAFKRVLERQVLAENEARDFRSFLLIHLGAEYARRGWVMQVHFGAQRTTSSRLRRLAGGAGGFAAIGPAVDMPALCRLLDDLERVDALPKTILYSLNPADYAPLAALTGSFAEDGVATKVQCGPAWWFNDQAAGIRTHLEAVANIGMLSTFVGMTTDSRSLLSMVRHEYFRRLLCDYFGEQVRAGAYPDDFDFLAGYIRRLAYDNARAWLPLPAPASFPSS